nr:MAG TPA: hypothetical protein [Caudoviricetes sp.]
MIYNKKETPTFAMHPLVFLPYLYGIMIVLAI